MVYASENPFRTQRIHALPYVFGDETLEGLLDRFEVTGQRGALVGPHGHGKSTLLGAIRRELAARGHEAFEFYLNDATPHFEKRQLLLRIAATRPDAIILLDGVEQLGWWDWRRVLRACGDRGLLITTHRPGRLPTLINCCTSLEIMDTLLAQLLGDEKDKWRAEALDLYARHQGNLRQVWFQLYERYAES